MKRRFSANILELWRKPAIRAIIVITVITIIASVLVGTAELKRNMQFQSFWDTVWWVLVTISTVGYGDKVPITPLGRIIGVLLMFFGVAVLSVVTATISSKFVTRMIKEGKGLQNVKFSDHILLCGWNDQSDQILQTIDGDKQRAFNVVLINNLPEEDVAEILSHYTANSVKFVRGDFAKESILNRANAKDAEAAIIVPDSSNPGGIKGDERTILATLSLKTINPKIKVYAHILDKENLSHLKKAQVDDVLVCDAYSGFLLANFVTSPGIPQFIEQLFSPVTDIQIRRHIIPEHLIGKLYQELYDYYQEGQKGILIGLGQVSESFDLSELLSGDYSYLDAFIMRKFQEAGRGIQGDEQIKIMINPPMDFRLTKSNFYFALESNQA
jgi:voltage-gated potassium channel